MQIRTLSIVLATFVVVLAFPGNMFCADEPAKPTEVVKPAGEPLPTLFPIVKDDKWGFIDVTGRLVIEPRFDSAWQFGDGVAKVKVNGKRGYIDKTGKYIWKPTK